MMYNKFVTLIEVDGYDCSYDDKIVVTKGFNRWEVTIEELRRQMRSDRPTFHQGYNIDPTQFPDLEPPYLPGDIVGKEYRNADWYFRLTATGAKEMLESWEENREGKEDIEYMDVELIREFIGSLDTYLKELRKLELGVDTGFGLYPTDYEFYTKMKVVKDVFDSVTK